jgi:selenocysteine-specific elongation factor
MVTGVIGTAGHVDHGKSTLVRAMTGIDPDRLAEEKARAMTIDLGFAWKLRPDGSRLSFVDVPGHERFIKNMLAGVGAIDAVLLVIAADEGPMPQTREHLAIIDLLGITNGVVALTKSDLVDGEWLSFLEEEVRELIRPTTIAGVPILPVSATTRSNLDALESTLIAQLQRGQGRIDLGRPRLSIDRAFTIGGFGTVVTGTLLDGALRIGDEVAILPSEETARIRGLQVHSTSVDRAEPGHRVAVNLAGVPVESIRRGQVVALPGSLEPADRLDARISLLPSAPKAIEQDSRFDFFQGAAEHPVWLTLLDRERIAPGEQGWVQMRFREPVVVARGDRFILRQASPSLTVGGGVVIDVAPPRHRRFQPRVIESLTARERGDPMEILSQLIARRIVSRNEISRVLPDEADVDATLAELETQSLLIVLDPSRRALISSPERLRATEQALIEQIDRFHASVPFRRGIPREELRQRISLSDPPGAFDAIVNRLAGEGRIAGDDAILRRADFAIEIPADRQDAVDRWLAAIDGAPFAPPSPDDFGIAPEMQLALTERGDLIRAAEGVFFTPDALRTIEAAIGALFDTRPRITLGDVRDRLGTSRKYAQAMLELLDARRVTRRIGDERIRLPARKSSDAGDER